MEINDELRELILVGASALELKKKALEQGMLTLRRSGLIKVAAGLTTLQEDLLESVLLRVDRLAGGPKKQERNAMARSSVSELLQKMIEMRGSELHINTNNAPR